MSKILQALLLGAVLAALAACGKEQPAAPKPAADAAPIAALAKGEEVFKKTCVLCHKTGEAGAPKLGDKDDWAPRIAQGMATLNDHAIKGYTGKKGMMLPKGGNASLSDEDAKAAVEYMVAQSK